MMSISCGMSPSPRCFHFYERENISVFVFPNDNELQSLGRIATEHSRARLFSRVFPEQPELWNCTLQTPAYKPCRRYVARLDLNSEPRAVVKFYPERHFAQTLRGPKVLRSGQALRVAGWLGRSTRHQVLALERIWVILPLTWN